MAILSLASRSRICSFRSGQSCSLLTPEAHPGWASHRRKEGLLNTISLSSSSESPKPPPPAPSRPVQPVPEGEAPTTPPLPSYPAGKVRVASARPGGKAAGRDRYLSSPPSTGRAFGSLAPRQGRARQPTAPESSAAAGE